MNSSSENKKLEPGVYHGTPDGSKENIVSNQPIIRTMKNDAEKTIKDRNETKVSIAIAEGKKRARLQAESLSKKGEVPTGVPKKRFGRFVIVVIIFIIAAGLIASSIFILPKIKNITFPKISLPSFPSFSNSNTEEVATTTAEVIAPVIHSLIPAETEKRFDIIKEARIQISNEILTAISNTSAPNTIQNLAFTETGASGTTNASINRLIVFSATPAPGILMRTLGNLYMVGLSTNDVGTSTPFIILKTSEHDLGVAGMLEWEPELPNFFDALFGLSIVNDTAPITFKDVVVGGLDARMFISSSNKTIFYTFANPTTIIITEDETTLMTLLPLAGEK